MHRSLKLAAALVLATVARTSTAAAQTNYSQAFSFAQGSSVPVSYLTLTVEHAGTFNFFTNSVGTGSDRPDPYVYLFTGTPDDLGAVIGSNDDGCYVNPTYCTGSSNTWDSFIRTPLGTGTYTFAMSRYTFTEAEARAGIADVTHAFGATLHITSDDGVLSVVNAAGPVVTPEPSTWALMGTGLAGVVGVARRRRRTA